MKNVKNCLTLQPLLFSLLALTIPLLSQAPDRTSPPAPNAIGLVLTGGGSFGAFEVGAVQAFFDRWKADYGEDPPVRVIAGTSTGALIGPFLALGRNGVEDVATLYQNVSQGDILSTKASALLPFALFSTWSSSAYGSSPLRRTLEKELPDPKIIEIVRLWPKTRLVVVATDFGTGAPAPFTNAPSDVSNDPARFRYGVLASAISPLATPPVYIKADADKPSQPNLDGGVHAVAPFQALFDLAARSPRVELTRVVVFSAYPPFPSSDSGQLQKPFPTRPQFKDIGARMDALISESSISKEISVAWAAIQLRLAGISADKVREITGLNIPSPPSELMVIAPTGRLGWNNLTFNKDEMRKMFKRGYDASPHALIP